MPLPLLSKSRLVITTLSIVLTILVFSQCISVRTSNQVVVNEKGQAFAGAEVCATCHGAISNSFSHTAHFKSSAAASDTTIKGSFSKMNAVHFGAGNSVIMEKSGNNFFQTYYSGDKRIQKERFDIVFGSGRKGQTYGYWKKDSLFQLPITYLTFANQWVNSPGLPDSPFYGKQIIKTCLECHSTYFQQKGAVNREFNAYVKNQMILGVSCERCHGAAASHVSFHQQHPEANEAKFIVSFKSLSRQQRLDACAVCHSGIRRPIKSTFSFSPGDTLLHYSLPSYSAASTPNLDVHSNQYGLLTASACFQKSLVLDCSTCHNPHRQGRNVQLLAAKCLDCHQKNGNDKPCKLAPSHSPAFLKQNCVDCHMPLKNSELINLKANNQRETLVNQVRTHLIGIYRDESRKVLLRKTE